MSERSERWLPVPNYEGIYEVSDRGRVRSLDRMVHRSDGWSRFQQGRERVLWVGPDGRRSVILSRGGVNRHYAVSVLVLTAFVSPRPEGMEVCHNDGDASNDWVGNLRWGTSSANKFDIVRHGNHHCRNKETCPRGHLLQPPNCVPSRLRVGHRVCRACACARAAAQRARRRGLEINLEEEAMRQFIRITSTAS